MRRGWWRRNVWGLIFLLPATAGYRGIPGDAPARRARRRAGTAIKVTVPARLLPSMMKVCRSRDREGAGAPQPAQAAQLRIPVMTAVAKMPAGS